MTGAGCLQPSSTGAAAAWGGIRGMAPCLCAARHAVHVARQSCPVCSLNDCGRVGSTARWQRMCRRRTSYASSGGVRAVRRISCAAISSFLNLVMADSNFLAKSWSVCARFCMSFLSMSPLCRGMAVYKLSGSAVVRQATLRRLIGRATLAVRCARPLAARCRFVCILAADSSRDCRLDSGAAA